MTEASTSGVSGGGDPIAVLLREADGWIKSAERHQEEAEMYANAEKRHREDAERCRLAGERLIAAAKKLQADR